MLKFFSIFGRGLVSLCLLMTSAAYTRNLEASSSTNSTFSFHPEENEMVNDAWQQLKEYRNRLILIMGAGAVVYFLKSFCTRDGADTDTFGLKQKFSHFRSVGASVAWTLQQISLLNHAEISESLKLESDLLRAALWASLVQRIKEIGDQTQTQRTDAQLAGGYQPVIQLPFYPFLMTENSRLQEYRQSTRLQQYSRYECPANMINSCWLNAFLFSLAQYIYQSPENLSRFQTSIRNWVSGNQEALLVLFRHDSEELNRFTNRVVVILTTINESILNRGASSRDAIREALTSFMHSASNHHQVGILYRFIRYVVATSNELTFDELGEEVSNRLRREILAPYTAGSIEWLISAAHSLVHHGMHGFELILLILSNDQGRTNSRIQISSDENLLFYPPQPNPAQKDIQNHFNNVQTLLEGNPSTSVIVYEGSEESGHYTVLQP